MLAKTDEGQGTLKTVMYVLCECIRIVAILIAPTMPRTPPASTSSWALPKAS